MPVGKIGFPFVVFPSLMNWLVIKKKKKKRLELSQILKVQDLFINLFQIQTKLGLVNKLNYMLKFGSFLPKMLKFVDE